MIEFICKQKPRLSLSLDNQAEITFTAPKSLVKLFEELPEKPLTVTVKEFRQKRSLTQNSYLWVLLDKIAEKVDRSKEDIYKLYIKDFGVFEIIPIKNEAADRFIKLWQARGLGWVCEDLGESKLNGYTRLMAFYGSSTYNTKEMARLIDAVVNDCKDMGIQAMSLSDIMLLQNDND